MGKFVHNNNVIAFIRNPNKPEQADYFMTGGLQITMDGGFQHTFPWELTETANFDAAGNPQLVNDETVFTGVRSSSKINIDEIEYVLVIQGFYPLDSAADACPATPPDAAITEVFETVERASTGGCLYASWEQERPVRVVKQLSWGDGPPAEIPAFDYTVDQSHPEMGWEDFSLQPDDVESTDQIQGTFLAPLDELTVTEQTPTPAYTPATGGWALAKLVCEDGAGASIGTTSLDTGSLTLADLPLAETTEQVPITCTFTNHYEPPAALSIVKKINGEDANEAPGVLVDPGTDLEITFEVTNTGQRPLFDIAITDTVIPAADIVAPDTKTTEDGESIPFEGVLSPGDSAIFTATYPAPAAGVGHLNVATATGDIPDEEDGTVTSNDDPGNATTLTPDISLNKISVLDDTNGNGYADEGEVIDYTFVVTNTGDVLLEPVTISDPMFSLDRAACVDSLAVGEEATCSTTAQYTVTAEDVAEGAPIVNTATAIGTVPTDPDNPVTDDDTEQTPTDEVTVLRPDISLDKWTTLTDTNGNGKADAGEKLVYQFDVTNTGMLTLAPVTITDAKFNLTNAACVDSLAPGETATCSTKVPYTVTAADVAAGKDIINTAVATGTVPEDPDNPVTDEDTVEVPIGPKPPDRPVKLPATGSDAGVPVLTLGLIGLVGLVARRRRS